MRSAGSALLIVVLSTTDYYYTIIVAYMTKTFALYYTIVAYKAKILSLSPSNKYHLISTYLEKMETLKKIESF